MKTLLISAFLSAAALITAPAFAGQPAEPDVEILVAPRDPSVKPFMLSLPAEGRPQHDVKPAKATPPPDMPKPEQTAMADRR